MLKVKSGKLRLLAAIVLAVFNVAPAFAFSSNVMCSGYMTNSIEQPVSGDAIAAYVDKNEDERRQDSGAPMCDGDMAKCSSCSVSISNPQDLQAFGEAHLNLPATLSYNTLSSFSFDRPPQIIS